MYLNLAWLQRTTDKFTYTSLLCFFLTPDLLLSIPFMFIWLLSGTVATFRIGFWLWQFDFPHAWLIASLISYRSLWEQMTTEIRKNIFCSPRNPNSHQIADFLFYFTLFFSRRLFKCMFILLKMLSKETFSRRPYKPGNAHTITISCDFRKI